MKLRSLLRVLAVASLAGGLPALADPLPPPQQPAKKKKPKPKDGDKKPDEGSKGDSKPKS